MSPMATEPSHTEADVERVESFVRAQGWAPERIEPLAGDVSARRYLRIHAAGQTAIAAVYPSEMWPAARRFLRTGELLTGVGLRVPVVLAVDEPGRLMLLEDAGGATCYDLAAERRADIHTWFETAGAMLEPILGLDLTAEMDLMPPLDADALDAELDQAVTSLCEWTGPRGEVRWSTISDSLDTVRGLVHDAAVRLPLRPAHRDFMLRNLVPQEKDALCVLDHQDLRPAPFGYDFASLVNDSIFPSIEVAHGLRRQALPDLAKDAFHWLSVQRTLKAAGTYARACSGGNEAHIGLIVPTLNRVIEHLEALAGDTAVTAELAGDLRLQWLDALID